MLRLCDRLWENICVGVGSSLFGGVGSNPTDANTFFKLMLSLPNNEREQFCDATQHNTYNINIAFLKLHIGQPTWP
jgi:hypothetical protein